jgi:DNA-binding NarL/FixJ family response regulator
MNSPNIRIAVLDSNPKSRNHLVKLLGKQPDISVVAEAEIGLAGINAVEGQRPDVILMGIKEPFSENLETTSMIIGKFPDTRVILLSRHSKKSTAASFCEKWACYFLCEECTAKGILAAIKEGHQSKNGSVPQSMGQSNSINQ